MKAADPMEQIRRLRAEGWTVRAIAEKLQMSKSAVGRRVVTMSEQDTAHTRHGWEVNNGHHFFRLRTPEMVVCPGCGRATNHLWVCWECRRYYSTCDAEECERCERGYPLEAFRSLADKGKAKRAGRRRAAESRRKTPTQGFTLNENHVVPSSVARTPRIRESARRQGE